MFRLSIDNLHKAFLAKVVSPVDLCHVFLKRIKRFKPLNAYITVADDTALLLEAAKSADRYARGTPLSVIDGIPFSVKDNFCTLNMRTTCASRTLESFVPPYSATVVERCLRNGALLIGKTNMDEFGMGSSSLESRFGAVYNPFNLFLRGLTSPSTSNDDVSFSGLRAWIDSELDAHNSEQAGDVKVDENRTFIAGGSSGGSAVSVATQTCVFALATDTGGSARNPAAHCGVAALKPSYGSLSRHGLVALMTAFDTPSIIASNVGDLNAVYDLLSGFDSHDATSGACWTSEKQRGQQPQLRVGVPTQFVVPGMSSDVRVAWQNALDCLGDSKHAHLLQCSVPHLPLAANCYLVIMCCEVASNFARYDGVRYGHRASRTSEGLHEGSKCGDDFDSFEQQLVATRGEAFGDTVKGRVVAGNYFLLRENATRFYEQARKVNRLILDDFERAFEHCDVLLTPTTAHPAPLVAHYRRSASAPTSASDTDQTVKILSEDVCTVSANLCGLPAVSIPVALSKDERLPISVQLIGKRGHEQTVLQLAAFLEQKFRFDRLIAEARTK